jgi:nitroreductase
MDFDQVLTNRQSIRKFKSTEISDETIREILNLAQLAPSAGNLQAYKIKIVKTEDKKIKLKEAAFTRNFIKQESVLSAPVLFVICADQVESEKIFKTRGNDLYAIQDATIFAAYLQLVITSKGLASVWVGSFVEEDAKNALSLPKSLRPIIIIPCGYSDEEPKSRQRKKLNELVI